jgi:hypothetical protein
MKEPPDTPGQTIMPAALLLLCVCRHTKHRQERVMKELSAAVPAPVDIEELAKIGRHAEVGSAGCFMPKPCF